MNDFSATRFSAASQSHNSAHLLLQIACRNGSSTLVRQKHSGPLRVQKALYPEGPDVCQLIIIHPPGGIVGGDQLSTQVQVGSSANVVVTTPGGTKWYRSNGQVSRQEVIVEVGRNASLEWLPQESIFYNQACVELDHTVLLTGDAHYLGMEVLCFGRTASGEAFETGSLRQRSTIYRNGKCIWVEQGVLCAGEAMFNSPLCLSGNTVCGTLIAAGKAVAPSVVTEIRERASQNRRSDAGFGVSQRKDLIVARYLGHSSEEAKRMLTDVWKMLRPIMLGRDAVMPRIWNT